MLVDPLKVSCPSCGALQGEGCVKLRLSYVHEDRYLYALLKEEKHLERKRTT